MSKTSSSNGAQGTFIKFKPSQGSIQRGTYKGLYMKKSANRCRNILISTKGITFFCCKEAETGEDNLP